MAAFLRTVAFGTGLIGAVASSQLPEFAQQYTQRLGGAVDELRLAVAAFDQDAARLGLKREEAVARLKSNADVLAQRRGVAAEWTIARYERLAPRYDAMASGQGVSRIWGAFMAADPDIARRAFQDFRPAVPVTWDGLMTAAAGFAAGVVIVFGLAGAMRGMGRGLRPRRKAPVSSGAPARGRAER